MYGTRCTNVRDTSSAIVSRYTLDVLILRAIYIYQLDSVANCVLCGVGSRVGHHKLK